MPEVKDTQLIGELIRATEDGKVRWIPTAKLQEFTAAFRGKYSVLVSELSSSELRGLAGERSEPVYELRVLDEFGDVLHTIDDPSVKPLLEAATRSSTSAEREQAINEILEELKSRYEKKGYPASPRRRAFIGRF